MVVSMIVVEYQGVVELVLQADVLALVGGLILALLVEVVVTAILQMIHDAVLLIQLLVQESHVVLRLMVAEEQ